MYNILPADKMSIQLKRAEHYSHLVELPRDKYIWFGLFCRSESHTCSRSNQKHRKKR